MASDKQTVMCVRCLKRKATVWTGHILRGRESISAGWCKRCEQIPGFVGHYRREMKTERDLLDLMD